MNNKYFYIAILHCFFWVSTQAQVVKPTPQQLSWHDMKYYAFVHFNMNTFTGVEWGEGTEGAARFNPSALDCRQWVRTFKEAGMKGVIITAKHHDGFCLWPSKFTEHSVKNSPWRDGKGDVLRELADACREYGLKLGVYLSPWDRNNPLYGTPEYNTYFKGQLEEVLTQYGDIFEVWFDGACGEGPNGKKQVYDWAGFIATVRKFQPNAVIFSDAGPDIRWVGNEQGWAGKTNWNTLNRDRYVPGTPLYLELTEGQRDGTHWVPAEVDVSTRPGWYFRRSEDNAVKSVDKLEQIYFESVGRGANLLLNIPVDDRGLVPPQEVDLLLAFKKRLDADFGKQIPADGSELVNLIVLEEDIAKGQHISKWSIQIRGIDDGRALAEGTTVGVQRYIKIDPTPANQIAIKAVDDLGIYSDYKTTFYNRPDPNYLVEAEAENIKRMAWWREAKFGMFIHWGAYAVPGGMYQGKQVGSVGEWIMQTANIPIPEYEQFVKQFNPTKFDAQAWVSIAKSAGMKYIVITSKHHDGFCLWDSPTTQYDIMDASPFQRDILAELKKACDEAGIKLCFYHSIMDWHQPDAESKGEYTHQNTPNPDFSRYRETYLKPQLRELVRKYDPAVMWFDGEWIPEWTEPQGKDLYQMLRTLKPSLIINNRVGKGRNGMQGMNADSSFVGDFGTPEQEILSHGGTKTDWESCMTMNDTWGYKRNDTNWKTSRELIHNLVDITAKGGNYLLNVGPTAEGTFPEASIERLRDMGAWLFVNSEAIYNTHPFQEWQEVVTYSTDTVQMRYTQHDNNLYATMLRWPNSNEITLRVPSLLPNRESPKVELLGYKGNIASSYGADGSLIVTLPSEWKLPENRACQHAWVLKIGGI